MQKARSEFPEIEDIRQDLDSLKSNVVELTRHIKAEGGSQALAFTKDLRKVAQDRLSELRNTAQREYRKVESQVKSKPSQSLATAFAAGLVLSWLFSRR